MRAGQLGPPDRLLIGLNPPFGKDGSLANKFVERAAMYHQPRIIVLIVPPKTKVCTWYWLPPALVLMQVIMASRLIARSCAYLARWLPTSQQPVI